MPPSSLPFPGLCTTCIHARTVPHPRGGTPYWMCGRAGEDPAFPRYPRLPVTRCVGHEMPTPPEIA